MQGGSGRPIKTLPTWSLGRWDLYRSIESKFSYKRRLLPPIWSCAKVIDGCLLNRFYKYFSLSVLLFFNTVLRFFIYLRNVWSISLHFNNARIIVLHTGVSKAHNVVLRSIVLQVQQCQVQLFVHIIHTNIYTGWESNTRPATSKPIVDQLRQTGHWYYSLLISFNIE